MLILIDQDGVLADFQRGFDQLWGERGHTVLPVSERRSFYIRDDYPAELRSVIEGVYTAPGFFRSLPPIPGAIAAFRELLELGHDLRICTAPLTVYHHSVLEKYEWVEQHLGLEFVSKIIMTKDKTLVHGDILIDDKPIITGARPPTWQRIIFDQPYNRQIPGIRMDWGNWREVLML